MTPLTRRHLLGLTAASAALAPFVPLLESDAEGAGTRAKRLFVFYTPDGSILRNWRPTGSETSWQLSEILAPLAAVKDEMIVLDGIDSLPAALAAQGELPMLGKGHDSMGSIFTQQEAVPGDGGATCNNQAPCDWPAGPSIDQYVASRLQADPNTATLHRAITPGVGVTGSGRQMRAFYGPSGQPVAPENNPQVLFDALFADALLEPAEKEQRRRERQSVIDVVKGDLASLRKRMGLHDRQRMEAHLEGILELERVIQGTIGECSVPSDPDMGGLGYSELTSNALRPEITNLQLELAAHAFACDLTRVVGFQWGREGSTGTATWLGQNVGIHTVSHHEGVSEEVAIQWMTELNRWYAERLADFIQLLADRGVWEDTLILWTMALAEGAAHNARNIPTVLIQGGKGYFAGGRYLTYGDFPDIVPQGQGPANADHGGESMNRVMTSVCHAMGFSDVDSFGDPKFGTGPLPGL